MNSNLAPAAATTPLVTAVAQPPAPASANINQMLSSLAPMQPTAPSPATVPAAESAPSASPSKKAKKRKKDEVDAAVGTPSRSQVRSTIHFQFQVSDCSNLECDFESGSSTLHSQIFRFRADKFFLFKICSDSEMSLEPRVSETRKSEPLQSSLLLITVC